MDSYMKEMVYYRRDSDQLGMTSGLIMTRIQERKGIDLHDISQNICTVSANPSVLTKLALLEHAPLVE